MDLSNKVDCHVKSQDRPILQDCNCSTDTCQYGGECRRRFIVYKATCRLCEKFYIGVTQNHLKERFRDGHLRMARERIRWKKGLFEPREDEKLKMSGAFAKHWANHFLEPDGEVPTKQAINETVKYNFVYCCKEVINSSKNFGCRSCRLCQQERLALLKAGWNDPDKVLNDRNEIYGACRHKGRIHNLQLAENTANGK